MCIPEFESHRCEILSFFSKNSEKEPTAESAFVACVGAPQLDASRRGERTLQVSHDTEARHEPWWGWGIEALLLCDPGSEKVLLLLLLIYTLV